MAITLDLTKLLGFRLLTAGDGVPAAAMEAKIGTKQGNKPTVKA